MNEKLKKLINILDVEQLDDYIFRGISPKPYRPRVFGGQIVAQAISAALRTVPTERIIHSLHSYFLHPGNPEAPITFEVDPIRNGGSFTTRRVIARQEGTVINNCSLSFQRVEQGLEHQRDVPSNHSPAPHLSQKCTTDKRYSALIIDEATLFSAWDIRSDDRQPPIQTGSQPPEQSFWLRIKETLPDDPLLHQCILGYISDWKLMHTALLPHRSDKDIRSIQRASLDHSIWFHAPFRADQWLQYKMTSPWAGSGRGLNLGSFFDTGGKLVASTAQEGLIRLK